MAHYLEKLPSLSRTKQIPTLLMALADLAAERTRRRLSHGPSRSTCHVTAQQRVGPICQYFDQHYKEEIEFSVLANKFHIDQTSLCRLFKQATGRTMTAYINELRVDAAAQLLINSDDSIIDICYRVGFGNYSSGNICMITNFILTDVSD